MNSTLIREEIDTEDDRTMIENELRRILRCRRFSNAPQMSAFLDYIVKQALDGKASRIKAYTVGVDALGKPPTFDAQGDPSVRVLALRLRKTLSQLHETSEAPPVQIQMRVGSYVPEFIKTSPPVREASATGAVADAPVTIASRAQQTSDGAQSSAHSRPVDYKENRPQRFSGSVSRSPLRLLHRRGPALTSPLLSRLGVPLILLAFSILIILLAWLSVVTTSPALANLSTSQWLFGSAERQSDTTPLKESIEISIRSSESSGQPLYLRSVSALLSASVIEAERLSVVWSEPQFSANINSNESEHGAYEVALSEIVVGNQSLVNAQLIFMTTGAVLSSKTMTFDRDTDNLSRPEIDQIIELSNEMKSPTGPLMVKFCKTSAGADDIACSG